MTLSPPPFDLDSLIEQLLAYDVTRMHAVSPLEENIAFQLCSRMKPVLLSQPMLLELKAPVKIVGDIHGQFRDLLRLLDCAGLPPKSNFLFLGDYVDRGKQSLETICLLFAFKIRFPGQVFLLRGNHECASINRIYGFYDECMLIIVCALHSGKRRFTVRLWKAFTDCFNLLPAAALIEDKILCMHGGLSPDLNSFDQIRQISRPTDVPDEGLLCDLLWSDPDDSTEDYAPNQERGVSVYFGVAALELFLSTHDLDLLVRAHQVCYFYFSFFIQVEQDGYKFFGGRKCVTVFTAPRYCNEFENKGAIMNVDDQLTCSFHILPLE